MAQLSPPCAASRAAAWSKQGKLTKPAGSMGALEELGVQLAGLNGTCPPPIPANVGIAIFAADHGVQAQGVTTWPQEVTRQMVQNFLAGGAVVNALARQITSRTLIVDVGVAGAPIGASAENFRDLRVRSGTADFTLGPALSPDEVTHAIQAGMTIAQELIAAGHDLLIAGDMGIANTTTSAAILAASLRLEPAVVTGRGTGINDAMLARKVEVIAQGLARHRPQADQPLAILAAFGGLEHAAMVGFLATAAAARVPVILDGLITAAAAVLAAQLDPLLATGWIAGHLSVEPGAKLALAHLDRSPLLDLELRLGEGSGAVLAVPLVQAAARILHEVATFPDAGVATSLDTAKPEQIPPAHRSTTAAAAVNSPA